MADQPEPALSGAPPGVLDSLSDGVLIVSPDGRIRALNRAGEEILGVPPGAGLGATLQALLPEDGGGDEFLDHVLAPITGETPEGDRVTYTREGRARRLSVRSRAWTIRSGPDQGRTLLTASFTDVTELDRLAEAEHALNRRLAEQNAALQEAYRDLEAAAARLRTHARRLQWLRMGATGLVFAVFVGVGAWSWLGTRDEFRAVAAPSAGGDSLVVQTRPVSARIAVVGALDAGAMVSVVGPFDGLVRERLFRYGGAVERGAVLLRMDVAEVEVRLREARSALIRARQRVEELRGWESGFEVSRARRQVAAAEMEAADLRTRVANSEGLLRRGIIPAEEHRNLLQQQRTQDLQLQAARQDLESTLARGDREQLRIAELELANAEVRVRDLERDIANAAVHAPVSGVVLLPPPAQGAGRPETVEVGSRVARGQTMFTIGDLESFQVRAQVDEIDISRVRVGQRVTVTGDAFSEFALAGEVTSVAAQASSEPGRGGLPSFGVTVHIRGIPPEQRARLAVGMSANLSIVTYDNPEAVVLPPEAVREGPSGRFVRVRQGGAVREVPVSIGIATPEGVEVRGGLSAGDVVLR
jgi:multidrug resistance efflux pump